MSVSSVSAICSNTDSLIPVGDNTPVRSELLCFVADKCRILPFDDLIKICLDFYKEDEVFAARNILDNYGDRLPKRKSTEKIRATLEDIAKAVLDPERMLPVFYATDLSRIPSVDLKHCDISVILTELKSLRLELAELRYLREEVAVLRQQVVSVKSEQDFTSMQHDVAHLKAELMSVKQLMVENRDAVTHAPCVPDGASNAQCVDVAGTAEVSRDSVAGSASFAGLTRRLAQDPSAFHNVTRSRKNKLIVGASSDNRRLKAVMTKSNVDVFISRLHPETSPHELTDCVRSVGHDVKICDVTCTKLQSKYEYLYSSYHVANTCSNALVGASCCVIVHFVLIVPLCVLCFFSFLLWCFLCFCLSLFSVLIFCMGLVA